MAVNLIAVAETAQDIGSSLSKFLDPVADYSADITTLIAQCFSTSSALRRVDESLGEYPHHHRRYSYVAEDLEAVWRSLTYTVEDVQRIFGGLGRGGLSGASYRRVWKELSVHFFDEAGSTLSRRLERYQQFLEELRYTLLYGYPQDADEFEDARDRVFRLLDAQNLVRDLTDDFQRTSLGVPNIPKPPSFERKRPKAGQAAAQPHSPPPKPTYKAGKRRTPGYRSPPMEYDNDDRRNRQAPFAPDPPLSPTTSTTTNTVSSSSQSSNTNSSSSSHWLPIVLEQSVPTSPLPQSGQTSACFGSDYGPSASKRLAQEYVKLLEIPFENGDLLIRLYHRPSDGRSRLHCRTIRPARSRKDCCIPTTYLDVERTGSSLHLVDTGSSSHSSRPWASLKFLTYEKLVLFFCSFIALRSEETIKPLESIPDSELHGEREYFGGKIVDDHYEHALRLYRDRDSGALRLQASVLRGELKRTPVWTAFITHQIHSPGWLDMASSRIVHLADLQRYIFTDDYSPQVSPTGEHELTFVKSSDAKEFVKIVNYLRDED